uniref:Uncharacterized protein n=1 Tax=Triticum urartu TaxID=4572 RepID=A0A8R7U993_TRIUA
MINLLYGCMHAPWCCRCMSLRNQPCHHVLLPPLVVLRSTPSRTGVVLPPRRSAATAEHLRAYWPMFR